MYDEYKFELARKLYKEDDFEIEEIKDPTEIAHVIESAIQIIKTYPMSKKIKQNRINFFATQR